MKIVITNKLCLTGASEPLRTEICTKLTMVNPAWAENDRMRRWNGKTERLLRFYEQTPDGLTTPRGFGRQLASIAKQFNEPILWEDKRNLLPVTEFDFKGALRDYQQDALTAILGHDWGVLSAPTGSGKTVMALAMVAARQQPALVVVHTRELFDQWVDRIESFMGIPRSEIGIIGAGKMRIGEKITVSLVQSLYKVTNEVAPHIGHLIIDECHRTPSRTFTEAVSAFDCCYVLGLSATPYRRDKLTRVIHLYLGDIVHTVDTGALFESGEVLRAECIIRETSFRTRLNPSSEYSKMLSELTADFSRNCLIAADVAAEAGSGGGICLALSDRKNHCEALRGILASDHNIEAWVLTGDTPAAQRHRIVERLNAGDIRVLLATGQLIGEGFDCRELSTLFLTTPIKFSGRVHQYLGRVLRPAPGKEHAKVYDYVDRHIPLLVASAKARRKVYSGKFVMGKS